MEDITKTAYSMILVKDTFAKAKLYANMMGYEGQWVGDWVNCKETQGNAQWVAVVMLPDSAFGQILTGKSTHLTV